VSRPFSRQGVRLGSSFTPTIAALPERSLTMKAQVHPEYPYSTISCACGNKVVTRTTRGDFTVDVCANCHPFYTGKQKIMDTAGRVDRFNKRFAKTTASKAAAAEKKQ
jgi:large subunit ribosomal protein L31